MEVKKVTVNITVEVFHILSARTLINQVADLIHEDKQVEGKLVVEDSDTISWKSVTTNHTI